MGQKEDRTPPITRTFLYPLSKIEVLKVYFQQHTHGQKKTKDKL